MALNPKFFASPAAFRAWLEKHPAHSRELWVGFHKKSSGKPSLTWPESVDAALCFGWIDGLRKRIDEVSYTIRFTPRKPNSTWSAINIQRVAELTRLGLMHSAGLKAFAQRQDEKSAIYSYEQRKERAARSRLRAALSAKQDRLGVLPGPAAGLSPTHGVLDQQREERRNPAEAPGPAHR